MYNYTWRISPCFNLPLPVPLLPFCTPFTYLEPSSCDRYRPPRSQVACKLTLPCPTPHPTLPLQIPRTPTDPRLTKTTSGIFRNLLSGTSAIPLFFNFPVSQMFQGYQCTRCLTLKKRKNLLASLLSLAKTRVSRSFLPYFAFFNFFNYKNENFSR